jgi:hypothetical protein
MLSFKKDMRKIGHKVFFSCMRLKIIQHTRNQHNRDALFPSIGSGAKQYVVCS